MARSRFRPRLRVWFTAAALLFVCAWLATWIPAVRFWETRGGSVPNPAQALSRPGVPMVSTPRPEPAKSPSVLDPAFVDRLLGREPELREDLLAWRFDAAFAKASSPEIEGFVAGELGKAVLTAVEWVKVGRILEVSARLAPLAASKDARVREALAEIAQRSSLPVAALVLSTTRETSQTRESSGASSTSASLVLPRGQLVRLVLAGSVTTGRVESQDGSKVTVRTLVGNGVAFPELEIADVEPVFAAVSWAEARGALAMQRGNVLVGALWLAYIEARGSSAPGLRAQVERSLR